MGGGDYGEIYLRKGVKGEEYEQKFPLRAAHFGIGIRRGNPELLQWLNTFVYADQEHRRAGCDFQEMAQRRADDPAAGLLGHTGLSERIGAPTHPPVQKCRAGMRQTGILALVIEPQ